jgi:alcohol dehydrogenase, propanol-preferring
MQAMLLKSHADINSHQAPLSLVQYPEPILAPGEVLIRVTACGVCHTEIDEIEGRIKPRLPIILGHQAVGIIEERSNDFSRYSATGVATTGIRVGVAWIASACGKCTHCLSGNENLCAEFKATGRDIDGGYAEYMKVRADFVHSIPNSLSDSEAAP